MLYFAYGSNLDWEQMRQRCPSARFVCVAKLDGYRFGITRESTTRRCGVANCVPDEGSEVWGVVYEIDDIDIGALDNSEGYRPGRPREKNAYVREERHVYRDGAMDDPLAVEVYFGIPKGDPSPPSGDYMRLVIDGALNWHLPQRYIEELESIKKDE